MKPDAGDSSVPREIHSLLSNERLILRETRRAVTALGGTVVFVAFLHKLGFVEKLRQHMPIQWKSPNQIDPTATFMAFLMAALAGAKRFAHANWLRNDRALHAVPGLSRITAIPLTEAGIHAGRRPVRKVIPAKRARAARRSHAVGRHQGAHLDRPAGRASSHWVVPGERRCSFILAVIVVKAAPSETGSLGSACD